MLELLFWVFCGAWLLFFGVLTCCVLSSRLSAQEESERIREWQREVREIRAS